MTIEEAKKELENMDAQKKKHSERLRWLQNQVVEGELHENDLPELAKFSIELTNPVDEEQIKKIVKSM